MGRPVQAVRESVAKMLTPGCLFNGLAAPIIWHGGTEYVRHTIHAVELPWRCLWRMRATARRRPAEISTREPRPGKPWLLQAERYFTCSKTAFEITVNPHCNRKSFSS